VRVGPATAAAVERVAGGRRIGENVGVSTGAGTRDEREADGRRCFKCGRDLGPLLEWKKMDTSAGPICYVCYNEAANDERHPEASR
jgi:hypothetical protein